MRHLLFSAFLALAILPMVSQAQTRLRIQHVCKIAGQSPIRLTGLGLVTGLSGTGDSAKAAPMINSLANVLAKFGQPVRALGGVKNAAVVFVEATIPAHGCNRGQRLDCYVSSYYDAKSLEGGRLFVTPLQNAQINEQRAAGPAGEGQPLYGLVAGQITIENPLTPTSARITNGVVVKTDVAPPFVAAPEKKGDPHTVGLVLPPNRAGFAMASEIARVINREFEYELSGKKIARPLNQGRIQVAIPEHHMKNVVAFVAQIMAITVTEPMVRPKVVINENTQTVVISGDAKISPVVITHRNLSINLGNGPAGGSDPTFIAIPKADPNAASGSSGIKAPAELSDLLTALNQLRVPTRDVIEIVRTLHDSGYLRADLVLK